MHKFLKIFLIAAIAAAIAGLFYWGYPIIEKRYFSQPEDAGEANGTIIESLDSPSGRVPPENTIEEPEEKEEAGAEVATTPPLADINENDCENECENFSGTELEYCRQICGLAAAADNLENCDNLAGIDRDYCLKDLALLKMDYAYCEKIKDGGIKKTCDNRLTEEIFDEENF